MSDGELDEWIEKAEEDYRMVQIAMRQRQARVYNSACFHSQQCAEKYLKAFLVRQSVPFRKTHDLTELLRLCLPVEPTFQLIDGEVKTLYPYASNFRYPGANATKEEARDAAAAVQKVREFVRSRLGLRKR
jgi:HEPN domain-containing protein